MTNDEALLQAIIEDPENDTPRLIYADWLEERGDPRAAYLRAEVELAALAPDAPEHAEAERRLAEARRGLATEWLAQAGRAYDLILRGYPPDRKIHVIKVIRELTGQGLYEAKVTSEPLPANVLAGVSRLRAEEGRHRLREGPLASVEVVIRPSPPETKVNRDRPEPGPFNFLLMVSSFPDDRREELALAVRELTGLSLPEAAGLVDRLPGVVRSYVTAEEGKAALARLLPLAEARLVCNSDWPAGYQPLPPAPSLVVSCDVVLTAMGPRAKLQVIRAVSEMTGLPLAVVKDRVESPLPVTLLGRRSWAEAVAFCRRFEPDVSLQIALSGP
jgi:uncharacterized protein (TIGR02996 family)